MFYCYIISHQCHLLFVPFSRVAWEAVIRYLPRSSSESWSQGWWMNACLHVWIHWEYHLPATLSGRVQAHDKCITLKHSFLTMIHLMFTFYIYRDIFLQLFTTIWFESQGLKALYVILLLHWTHWWGCQHHCFITSAGIFVTIQEIHLSWICLALNGSGKGCAFLKAEIQVPTICFHRKQWRWSRCTHVHHHIFYFCESILISGVSFRMLWAFLVRLKMPGLASM